MPKLTLIIDEVILGKAKIYAANRNISLSNLIENYLKSLSLDAEIIRENKSSQIVDSLKGSFKVANDFDYKVELRDRLGDKYL